MKYRRYGTVAGQAGSRVATTRVTRAAVAEYRHAARTIGGITFLRSTSPHTSSRNNGCTAGVVACSRTVAGGGGGHTQAATTFARTV